MFSSCYTLIVEMARNETDEKRDYDNIVETLVNTVIEEFQLEKITCTAYTCKQRVTKFVIKRKNER